MVKDRLDELKGGRVGSSKKKGSLGKSSLDRFKKKMSREENNRGACVDQQVIN